MRRVAVFGLGGTIASLPDEGHADGVVPNIEVSALVNSLPGLEKIAHVESRNVRQMPSSNFSFADLVEVVGEIDTVFANGFDGVVVTQGTDNVEETSFALDLLVGASRPVVVTGAMRNPSLEGADGPANIMAAVAVAASPLTEDMGTLVVMNDEIHAARFVRKTHASSLSAFTSSVAGPLGIVVEGRVHLFARVERIVLERPHGDVPPVALVRCALGDDGRIVSALLGLGYHGLVIEGFGGGHVPMSMVESLAQLAKSMPVVLASRTGAGVVLASTYGFSGGEIDLLDRGLIAAGALDGLKARVALSLALASTNDRADAESRFRAIVDAVG